MIKFSQYLDEILVKSKYMGCIFGAGNKGSNDDPDGSKNRNHFNK